MQKIESDPADPGVVISFANRSQVDRLLNEQAASSSDICEEARLSLIAQNVIVQDVCHSPRGGLDQQHLVVPDCIVVFGRGGDA